MAKENNTILALVAVLIFSTVGLIIKQFLDKTLTGMNETGIVGDILNFIKSPGLFDGLLWLVVSIVIYFGIGSVFSSGKKVGPISLLFLLLWIFTILGLIVGNLIWLLIEGFSISLNLDLLINTMAFYLTISLGPTFAAALGISNKKD